MRPDDGNTGCAGITLFGVKIAVSSDGGDGGDDGGADFIRRTKSTGNIDNKCIPENVAAAAAAPDKSGCVSDGNHDSIFRERKRGTPWTEEEHRSFLEGLHKLGKGDWKGISSKFVPSRKSSQVASHAQKYFNRVNTMSQDIKKRRRASVFDITSEHDTAASSSSAATTNVNASNEPSIPTHVPNSERPPLAPVKQSVKDACSIIYQTRVPSITKAYKPQALIPSITWVPMVTYPNQQNGVFVPHGGFMPQQPWQQTLIRPAPKSMTNNDVLNIHIRNLTL